MIIRKLRLQRGWSQEQLSEMSGLSVRTIQRIERGDKAGLESLKSLAAVFEVQIADLQKEPEPDMTADVKITEEETRVINQVREIKGFYSHLMTYALVITGLFLLNYMTSPEYIWAWWPAMGWGIGIVSHGLSAFEVLNFFGADWERKQVEKRLGRKL
ncbi:XRE family transcriptional regulator [Enterovibrio norvegicus]|uniref:2TM domain-containing protein n=1 Tax=Enterovibrio norvegicus TaxID=188144 RepID=UPI00031B0269|nr:2TM domain-containing protein [Enterovibrio norvegicus]MCC4797622.1 2TM domain-containing protein [Enterovibrio norvegicus]OEE57831.1 XRE family transcriptional regulator [Enterovibrio norvegicus]OEF56250.1 XRE family transcriptional regulator [Enterovibrio norvegicus]PMH60688.1 XRE family transcriptional regulator [Enterovibrio norvegicus]PMI35644.1 XRE family transcriptional regulator [Enterovibrio norvegicus]